MIFKINGETYEIKNFNDLEQERKTKVYDTLMIIKATMDTLAENGYIEHGVRVEAYKRILEEKFKLEFVHTTDANVVDL